MREQRHCPVCGEAFEPRRASTKTCSRACNARAQSARADITRSQVLAARQADDHDLVGSSVVVKLDDPRCGECRLGTVAAVATVGYRPLLTVRLDKGGWPGGTAAGFDNHDTELAPGWYVELREEEVVPISMAERYRLQALAAEPTVKLSKRERDRINARNYRERKRPAV